MVHPNPDVVQFATKWLWLDVCRRLATDRFYRIPDNTRIEGVVVRGSRSMDQEAGGARGWNAVPADFRWMNSASVER